MIRSALFHAFVAAALLAASASRAPAYQEIAVVGGGEISGTVRFTGPLPAPEEIVVPAEHRRDCDTLRTNDALLIGRSRGVKNVVVTIDGISSGKAIALAAMPHLANVKCAFEPRVQTLPVGTKLEIRNDDATLHNVHARLAGKDLFNIALPMKGLKLRKALMEPGVVDVACDAGHTWMKAFIVVTDHPYSAVTDTAGVFSMTEIPPGTYNVTAWHETLGMKTQQVVVRAAASSELRIEYAAAAPAPATPPGTAEPR
jgi:plastocyanin